MIFKQCLLRVKIDKKPKLSQVQIINKVSGKNYFSVSGLQLQGAANKQFSVFKYFENTHFSLYLLLKFVLFSQCQIFLINAHYQFVSLMFNEKEENKPQNISSSDQSNESMHEKKENRSQKASQYFDQYLQYIPKISIVEKVDIEEKLAKHGFQKSNSFVSKLFRSTLQSCRGCMKIEVRYGHFKNIMHIHNSEIDLLGLKRSYIAQGAYSRVIEVTQIGQKFAGKILQINDKNNAEILDIVLREVFLTKFAAALGVGPQFKPLLGFDAIFTKNKMYFFMEMCLTNTSQVAQEILDAYGGKQTQNGLHRSQKLRNFLKNQLSNHIKIMHSVGFIHRDIKPDNIGWSQKEKKLVFLDFGLSVLIKQKPGALISSKFVGTFNFVCEELKKAYYLNSSFLIDFFYNDIFGVRKLIESFLSDSMQDCFDGSDASLARECSDINELNFQLEQQYSRMMKFLFFIFKGESKQAEAIFAESLIKRILRQVYFTFQQQLRLFKKELPWTFVQKYESEASDYILSVSFTKMFSGIIFVNTQNSKFSETIQSILANESCLIMEWNKSPGMEKIFSYLTMEKHDKSKQKLMKIIILHIYPQKKLTSDFQTLSFLLNEFGAYFQRVRNLYLLKKVSKCFYILYNLQFLKINNQRILALLKQNYPDQYIRYLFDIVIVSVLASFRPSFQYSQYLTLARAHEECYPQIKQNIVNSQLLLQTFKSFSYEPQNQTKKVSQIKAMQQESWQFIEKRFSENQDQEIFQILKTTKNRISIFFKFLKVPSILTNHYGRQLCIIFQSCLKCQGDNQGYRYFIHPSMDYIQEFPVLSLSKSILYVSCMSDKKKSEIYEDYYNCCPTTIKMSQKIIYNINRLLMYNPRLIEVYQSLIEQQIQKNQKNISICKNMNSLVNMSFSFAFQPNLNNLHPSIAKRVWKNQSKLVQKLINVIIKQKQQIKGKQSMLSILEGLLYFIESNKSFEQRSKKIVQHFYKKIELLTHGFPLSGLLICEKVQYWNFMIYFPQIHTEYSKALYASYKKRQQQIDFNLNQNFLLVTEICRAISSQQQYQEGILFLLSLKINYKNGFDWRRASLNATIRICFQQMDSKAAEVGLKEFLSHFSDVSSELQKFHMPSILLVIYTNLGPDNFDKKRQLYIILLQITASQEASKHFEKKTQFFLIEEYLNIFPSQKIRKRLQISKKLFWTKEFVEQQAKLHKINHRAIKVSFSSKKNKLDWSQEVKGKIKKIKKRTNSGPEQQVKDVLNIKILNISHNLKTKGEYHQSFQISSQYGLKSFQEFQQ